MNSVVAKSLDITNLKYDHLNYQFLLENLPTINDLCEIYNAKFIYSISNIILKSLQ